MKHSGRKSKITYEIMHMDQITAQIDTLGKARILKEQFLPYDLYLEEEEDLITLNPGSMTYPRQSGRQPSYMVMTLDKEGKASFEIKYL